MINRVFSPLIRFCRNANLWTETNGFQEFDNLAARHYFIMQQYAIYSRKSTAKLQRALLDKSKLTIDQVGFAKLLSIAIFTQTEDYVSETTIRRLFELVPSMDGPSLLIMNMLSRYVGFESWLDLESSVSDESSVIAMPSLAKGRSKPGF